MVSFCLLDAELGVPEVHSVVPFTIQALAISCFELAEKILNFNDADGVAADEREHREEIEMEDFDPKLTGGMFQIDLFPIWGSLITEKFEGTKVKRTNWRYKK